MPRLHQYIARLVLSGVMSLSDWSEAVIDAEHPVRFRVARKPHSTACYLVCGMRWFREKATQPCCQITTKLWLRNATHGLALLASGDAWL